MDNNWATNQKELCITASSASTNAMMMERHIIPKLTRWDRKKTMRNGRLPLAILTLLHITIAISFLWMEDILRTI